PRQSVDAGRRAQRRGGGKEPERLGHTVSADKLRSSQLITTFGPGAMVDFPDASVIVGGLDTWKYDSEIPVVEEPRLVEKLRKLLSKPNITLRSPPPANERGYGSHPGITGWRFP